jgi:hypothetical protein
MLILLNCSTVEQFNKKENEFLANWSIKGSIGLHILNNAIQSNGIFLFIIFIPKFNDVTGVRATREG